jgi:hypothetical protein
MSSKPHHSHISHHLGAQHDPQQITVLRHVKLTPTLHIDGPGPLQLSSHASEYLPPDKSRRVIMPVRDTAGPNAEEFWSLFLCC